MSVFCTFAAVWCNNAKYTLHSVLGCNANVVFPPKRRVSSILYPNNVENKFLRYVEGFFLLITCDGANGNLRNFGSVYPDNGNSVFLRYLGSLFLRFTALEKNAVCRHNTPVENVPDSYAQVTVTSSYAKRPGFKYRLADWLARLKLFLIILYVRSKGEDITLKQCTTESFDIYSISVFSNNPVIQRYIIIIESIFK